MKTSKSNFAPLTFLRRAVSTLAVSACLAVPLAAINFGSGPATAVAACNCSFIAAQHRSTRQAINNHTTEVGRAIAETILKATQQTSAYLDRQVFAQERIVNAQMQNDAIKLREEARAQAESGAYDPGAGACAVTSLLGSLFQSTAGGGGNGRASPNGFDIVNKSRNWARGIGPGGEEVREGSLAVVNGMIRDRDRFENLDGYLDPTSDVRFLMDRLTINTDDENVEEALWRMHQNFIDPVPPPPVTGSQANTPEGRTEIARRLHDDAVRSAAANLMAWHINSRTPVSTEASEQIRKMLPDMPASAIPDKASKLEVVNAVVQYYNSQDFIESLSRASMESVLRTLVQVQAAGLDLDWMRYQLDSHRSVMDAATLAASVGSERVLSR